MTHDDTAARDAAGVQLLHQTFVRWRDMPPVKVTLDRSDAWTVLLAMQTAVAHPAFTGSGWGRALESVGRQLQEGVCDDAEIYAAAERGWPNGGFTAPGEPDAEPDTAGIRLMTDAYTRWATMPEVTVSADRIDIWAVIMGLQAAFMHPLICESAMGPVVELVGRQLQEGLCDSAELFAMVEAGWHRAVDVDPPEAGQK